MRGLVAISALVLVATRPGTASAGPAGRVVGKVTLTEADGKPATDADVIVYVVGFKEPPGASGARIEQKGRKFVPDLVAVTAGESVTFPNSDPFLHNVFSQSATRKFDLGSFKLHDAKTKDFPSPGVVDVYCNIHPEMAATILVLPNRRHVHVNRDGSYVLEGVPPGAWTVFAYARRATRPASAKVSIQAGADAHLDLTVQRGVEPAHLNKYGEKYRPGAAGMYH